MNKLNSFDWLALILVIIGGINWGIYGIWGYDLVAVIFGSIAIIAKIIYILVGISAVYLAIVSSSIGRK
ncbi:MAG: DUF378 domain-containing protein [Candidatus Paceibacterota bacterium]|jgi:hypothetical protein